MKVIVLKDMCSLWTDSFMFFFYYVTSVSLCNIWWFCSQQVLVQNLSFVQQTSLADDQLQVTEASEKLLIFSKSGYMGSWQLWGRCCCTKAWEIRKVSCRFMYRCCGIAPLIYTSFDYMCSERTFLYGCWNMFRVWVLI